MNNNKDTMARLPAGMRAYAYRASNQARVALHLPHGTEAIDLSAGQMQRFAERLGELAGDSTQAS
ncbi:hypothetical protein SAMN04488531_1708 [Corynebacterium coyleae]|uniref:Uncharacterized protein n=1 Tax=Corynebacterium coyleae TaxID=53374 RepID=A0ABX8KT64_9CORY|nr:hypothetical protein [Corynebacterium coyleae]QXB17871.1 hypothetical protein I6L55_08185 [Corynebacterium coyleae]WJY79311.1 hypothetical protein CCOY_03460 [Corynebacterium coyleae]SEB74442.1 hypothetical protein SAMN04488531_1708 [Corynebacterium coyleae]